MTHICVSKLGQHWFRWWPVVYSAPSHHLKWCCHIDNRTPLNLYWWNSFQENNVWQYYLRNGCHLVSAPMCEQLLCKPLCHTGCGGKFRDDSGIITSPGYPGNYFNNANCTYLIEIPAEGLVTLRTIEVFLEKRFDYLRVSNTHFTPCIMHPARALSWFAVVKSWSNWRITNWQLTNYGVCG